MNLQFDIRGIPEVKELLESIAPKHAKAILRNTNYAVAAEVRKEARSRVEVSRGDLKKSIAVKHLRGKPNKPSTAVYFKTGGFYWRFLEHGTKSGTRESKKGRKISMKHPGSRPKPFMKNATEAVRERLPHLTQEKFVIAFQKAIARELKKRAKS